MKEYKRTIYISSSLIIGSIIGLFLDIYQIDLFGAVGLGIVYTPIIGLFLGVVVGVFFTKESRIE